MAASFSSLEFILFSLEPGRCLTIIQGLYPRIRLRREIQSPRASQDAKIDLPQKGTSHDHLVVTFAKGTYFFSK
jgi:hypothetical protein